jgi:hypothetical protein
MTEVAVAQGSRPTLQGPWKRVKSVLGLSGVANSVRSNAATSRHAAPAQECDQRTPKVLNTVLQLWSGDNQFSVLLHQGRLPSHMQVAGGRKHFRRHAKTLK